MRLLNRKNDFSDWLDSALKEVRFAPDRKKIGVELQAHYEDHYDALLDCGYSPEEAAVRSLEALGDPCQVGQALNRVHNYYLGILWMVSRVLVIALAILVVVSSVLEYQGRSWIPAAERTAAQLTCSRPPVWAAAVSVPGGTVYLAPREGSETDETGNTIYTADLWLKSRTPLPKFNNWQVFSLADQTGELPFVRFAHEEPASNYGRLASWDTEQGWLRQHGTVNLYLDHSPNFLVLNQPFGEEPWSIRCDWEVTP